MRITDTIRNAVHRRLDAVLSGRRGEWSRRLLRCLLSLHPEYRAALMHWNGDLSAVAETLRRRKKTGARGRILLARCEDALSVMEGTVDVLGLDDAMAQFRCRHVATTPLRVLYVQHSCSFFDPSGYASRSDRLASALLDAGVEVESATRLGYPCDLPEHGGVTRQSCINVRNRSIHLLENRSAPIDGPESIYIDAYAAALVELACQRRIGVIHAASNYLNGLAAVKAARVLGIPSVYEMRGLWHLTRAFREPGYAASDHFRYVEHCELLAARAASRVLVISEPLRQWLIEHDVDPVSISVLGNAADPLVPNDRHDPDPRADLGIGDNEYVLGYFGALAAYEGLDTLVTAIAKLPTQPVVRLLLLGSGDELPRLRRLCNTLGMTDRVIFVGRVPQREVVRYLGVMDRVVLPRRDHLVTRLVPALKPFEALAAGVPVSVSPALAAALSGTLDVPFDVLPGDGVDALVGHLSALMATDRGRSPGVCRVPTWADRAAQLARTYAELRAGA